jgi:signal transduction histidine kinase
MDHINVLDFDVRTAFLLSGFFYLILPLVVWVVLAAQRSIPVALWCAAGLLSGMTGILIAQQSSLPAWVNPYFSALAFLVAALLRIQSLRLDLGWPWRLRWLVLGVLVWTVIFLGIHYGVQSSVLRARFNFSCVAILFYHLAWLAWRIGVDEPSPNAKWIAGWYALAATAMLGRVFFAPLEAGNANLLNESFSAHIIVITMLISAVVSNFGYIGLHLDRSRREELKAVANRVRDEEARRLGAQIAQLDRQRSLGEMSTALSHEINQPLTAILANAEVAQMSLQQGRFDPVQVGGIIDKIIRNTLRASRVIERIRGFIQPGKTCSVPVNLGDTVREVLEIVDYEVRHQKVNVSFTEKLPAVHVLGDAIQISQIIVNVMRNAIEALAQVDRRKIEIVCENIDGQAILRIQDSGPGMASETLEKIASPFFTTKPDGLGVGLSISSAIASQHGGKLTITNAMAGGALVELTMPALPEGHL